MHRRQYSFSAVTMPVRWCCWHKQVKILWTVSWTMMTLTRWPGCSSCTSVNSRILCSQPNSSTSSLPAHKSTTFTVCLISLLSEQHFILWSTKMLQLHWTKSNHIAYDIICCELCLSTQETLTLFVYKMSYYVDLYWKDLAWPTCVQGHISDGQWDARMWDVLTENAWNILSQLILVFTLADFYLKRLWNGLFCCLLLYNLNFHTHCLLQDIL